MENVEELTSISKWKKHGKGKGYRKTIKTWGKRNEASQNNIRNGASGCRTGGGSGHL